jgi:hypothetical protein
MVFSCNSCGFVSLEYIQARGTCHLLFEGRKQLNILSDNTYFIKKKKKLERQQQTIFGESKMKDNI